uniref:Uncharacterized protein n=1 Tax=Zea mays TaxID=4577 RepID=B6TWE5_MAIZE|nr:hypothetical protein [Zea mays]
MATGGWEAAPVDRPRLVKTPSGNPLPRRRGQVKERIVRDIAEALATAAALALRRQDGRGQERRRREGGRRDRVAVTRCQEEMIGRHD